MIIPREIVIPYPASFLKNQHHDSIIPPQKDQ